MAAKARRAPRARRAGSVRCQTMASVSATTVTMLGETAGEGRGELPPHLAEVRERWDSSQTKPAGQRSHASGDRRRLTSRPALDQALGLLGQRTSVAAGKGLEPAPCSSWFTSKQD